MNKTTKKMVQQIMNQPREQIVEKLMRGFSQILTTDQYKKAEQAFLTMSDDDFRQMVEDSIQQKAPTVAQHINLGMRLAERYKITPENSALNKLPAKSLSPEENDELWKAITGSHPTDSIYMKKEEDIALCKLWRKGRSLPKGAIPTDIFFTGKIRFMDCYIVVDETADENGLEVAYRVVVFPDYQERIRDADGKPVYVGAVVVEYQDYAIFIPLRVCEGVDVVMGGGIGFHNAPDEVIKGFKKMSQMDVLQICSECMSTWYGIQTTPEAMHEG